LTIITCREPGYLWKLGIPFFWGPINGAALMPWAFLRTFGWRGGYRHLTRNLLNRLQTRLARRSRAAARAAVKVWAVTREDKELVESVWGAQAEAMVETGASPREDAKPIVRKRGERLRIAWCGIIEARKALHLLLDALASLGRLPEWELHVIGDGPDAAAGRARARRLGIADAVRWHGKVEHSLARDLIGTSHLLAHPALKEGTPHVVLEALSVGVPVLCHDACGMGIVVDESCGIKVPLESPAATVEGFRSSLARLLDEPSLVETLSEGALRRALEMSWDTKVEEISRAYNIPFVKNNVRISF
jgi:glycosyltransferase involved in cell wall biosynthesis